MEKKIYITEEEREKCQKVADAFADLYEMADIVVFDVASYAYFHNAILGTCHCPNLHI